MPVPSEFQFLPEWPIALGSVGWFALLLLLAAALGEAASRVLRLPKIAGYVLGGILLGPYGFAVYDAADVAQMQIFVDIAFGLLLFELGHRLDLGWLRLNPWLLASSVLEAGIGFGAVFAALVWLGVATSPAVTAAAIGMATSPAVILRIASELRAQGQVTERLLTLTALNNIYAVLTITGWLAWLHFERSSATATLVYPLYLICGSFLLAAAGAIVVRYLLNVAGRSEEVGFLMLAGALILLITLARAAHLSMLLCLLVFGTLSKYIDPRLRAIPRPFGAAGSLFIVVLFTLTGASLDLQPLSQSALIVAAVYVVTRLCGKVVGVLSTARPSGINLRKAALLGAALSPMSGLATALMLNAAIVYSELTGEAGIALFAAVAMLELAAPIITHFALIAAREANVSARDS
jgi:Kef-type K+ transport system membrane component KefB